MNTASAVITFLFVVKLIRTEDCDVRMWYLKLTSQGAFDGKLSEEQIIIRKTINEMVLRSKKDTSKGKVSCDILEMYEEMLKPDDEGDVNDTQKDNEENNDQQRSDSDTTQEVASSDDSDGGSTAGTTAETEESESKSNEEMKSSEDDSSLSGNANDDETNNALDNSGGATVKSAGEDTEQDTSHETDNDETDTTENEETEVDETELLSDDSYDDDEEGVEEEEEDEEETKTLKIVEEKILSDDPSKDLDKTEHESLTSSSIEEFGERTSDDNDRSVEISEETLVSDDDSTDKSKDEKDENRKVETKETEDTKGMENEPSDKETNQKGNEKNVGEDKDKQTAESAAIDADSTQETNAEGMSGVGEELSDEESNDKEKYTKEIVNQKEKSEVEASVGGFSNTEKKKGDISRLSSNTPVTDSVREHEHVPFGMCRAICSYQFDIFDLVQNTVEFVENTTLSNQTKLQNSFSQEKSKLDQDISVSRLSSPVTLTYNRLVCSPCSLLLQHSTSNTSCSGNSVGSRFNGLKSNETQTNQKNTKSDSHITKETTLGMETSKPRNENETEKDILETPSRSIKEKSDTQSHSKDDEKTDEKDTDLVGASSGGKTDITDTVATEKIEDNQGNDLSSDNDIRMSDSEISSLDANSDQPKIVRDGDENKGNDETTEKTGPGIEQKTKQEINFQAISETTVEVLTPETDTEDKSSSDNDDRRNDEMSPTVEIADSKVIESEVSGMKLEIDKLKKSERTFDGKQTEIEEKRTKGEHGKVDEKQPSKEINNKATSMRDQNHFLEQIQSNFDDFQEQVVSKTESYSNKLQNLELMVVRLENQLLKEKLNKNNHSSTITRMENHILRLENELLKLNQSYTEIKEKSDSMVKDRKKYLELGHNSQQTPAYGYSAVSGRIHPISVDFQAKITYLTKLLSNQSMTIRQLKSRSEYLEDQNRLLYNMIMNQTALMTQIMTRVQDLTEQNIQQRFEAQKIRQQMEQIVNKRSVTETTDKFLLYKLEEMVSDVRKTTLEDDEMKLKQEKMPSVNKNKSEEELERYMLNESVKKTEPWCGASFGTCVFATFIKSICVPHSLLQWKKCKQDRSEETQKNILKTPGPSTLELGKEINVDENSSSKAPSVIDRKEAPSVIDRKEAPSVIDRKEAPSVIDRKEAPSVIDRKEAASKSEVSSNNEMKKMKNNSPNKKSANENIHTVDTKVDGSQTTEQKEGHTKDTVKTTSENKEHEKQGDSHTNKVPATHETQQVEKEGDNVKDASLLKASHAKENEINGNDVNSNTTLPTESRKVVEKEDDVKNTAPEVAKVTERQDKQVEISLTKEGESGTTTKDVLSQKLSDNNSKATDGDEKVKRSASNTEKHKSEIIDKEERPIAGEEKDKMLLDKKSQAEVEKLNTAEDAKSQKHTGSSKESDFEKVPQSPKQKSTENADKVMDGTSTKKKADANNAKESKPETPETQQVQDKKEAVKKEDVKSLKKEQQKKEKPKTKEKEKVVNVKSAEKKSKEPLRKPIKYQANGQKEPKDCYDYYKRGKQKNGVFKIKPYGRKSMVEVYCDMKNGGWTVIQKRQDGTTKFMKKWRDFKEGFGGIRGEHWLGNDHIHYLTNQDHYTLMIELTDWNKTKKFAEYDYFMVDDEEEGYRLHIGGYHGDAGDGMAKHNNHKFSTTDVDNDKVTKEFGGSCAKRFSGAWWYYKCYMSNLNGIYYRNGVIPPKLFDGVTWKPWTGSNYSLRSAEMKIRPSSLT